MKLTRIISSTPSYVISFFRRVKFDNFIGGLIVGAIFSLVINIATVQVQESISKQRVLEALEREIVGHSLLTNSVYGELNDYIDSRDDSIVGYYPNSIHQRLNTKVWESAEIDKYIFQLSPEASSHVSVHYTVVNSINKLLDNYQAEFDTIFNKQCNTFFKLYDLDYPLIDKKRCNDILEYQIKSTASAMSVVDEDAKKTIKIFHPAQDRLNSFWMKRVLGGESIEVLKNYDYL